MPARGRLSGGGAVCTVNVICAEKVYLGFHARAAGGSVRAVQAAGDVRPLHRQGEKPRRQVSHFDEETCLPGLFVFALHFSTAAVNNIHEI
ncbi:hypothetical protein A6M21_13675 [Desulfotomaculum copahuensis]|uniref:Uncharacterized protein n=1 Tax=Desulfotomaculum copahuensis TaxID=1838280 RepID=A0A1B7LC68_9FIRM|nr:hypothetical protein A6M21_13675 [Desulfotomaculum copahuensis]